MESVRVAKNSITLPDSILKDLQIQNGDSVVLVKNDDGGYSIKTKRDILFEDMKREAFAMADELGLTTVEEVRKLALDLLHSYEESERGEVLDGESTLSDLRASYEI